MPSEARAQVKIFQHKDMYYKYVRGRTLIYLDQNIWINLEEGKHQDVLTLLKALKARGRIVCPLSFSLVEELFNQPTQELRQRRAKLMDELSGGITVRDSKIRERTEVRSIFETSERAGFVKEHGYSVAAEFLGDMVLTPADDSLLALKVAEFCAKHGEASEELRSVLWLVNHMSLDDASRRQPYRLPDYVSRCEADLIETRKDLKKFHKSQRRERALRKMRLKQLTKYARYLKTQDEADLELNPNSPNQAVEDFRLPFHHCQNKAKIVEWLKEPDKVDGLPNDNLLGAFFHEIPTVELRHQYYANTYLGTRRPKRQDFFDVEHLTTIPYVDFFVTSDGYLKDVVRATAIPQKFGCRLVEGTSELLTHLGNLLK